MDLTRKIKEIRKFSKFGLIEFSEHSHERGLERGLTRHMILSMLSDTNNTIAQFQEHYRGATHPSYVILAKSGTDGKYYHIVLYEEISQLGGHKYYVSTAYLPSDKYFSNNGRYLKKKLDRKKEALY